FAANGHSQRNRNHALRCIHDIGMGFLELLSYDSKFGVRRCNRGLWLKPSRHVINVSLVGTVGIELLRKIKISGRIRLVPAGQHSENYVSFATKDDGLTYNLGIAAETVLPEIEREHRELACIRLVLFR